MTRLEFLDKLEKLNACPEALDWVGTHSDSPGVMWVKCKRADWMLWLAIKTSKTDDLDAHVTLIDCLAQIIPGLKPDLDWFRAFCTSGMPFSNARAEELWKCSGKIDNAAAQAAWEGKGVEAFATHAVAYVGYSLYAFTMLRAGEAAFYAARAIEFAANCHGIGSKAAWLKMAKIVLQDFSWGGIEPRLI